MEDKNRDNEIEIDLGALLFEFLKYWKVMALSALLTGFIGLMISKLLLTPQYQSMAELFVLSKSTSITSLADVQLGTSLTNDYMVIVKERPVLEQVIENLGIKETYNSLNAKVSVNNPTNSRLLQITVTDVDPDRAKVIADEVATVVSRFIAMKMDQQQPSIISYGYADGKPVSPSVLRNTAIGALLGLVLAGAVITALYLLNDTIENAEDVEKKLGLNLLGTLPYEEPERELAAKASRLDRRIRGGHAVPKEGIKGNQVRGRNGNNRNSKSKRA